MKIESLTVQQLMEELEKVADKSKRVQLVHMQKTKSYKNMSIIKVQIAKAVDEKQHYIYIRSYVGDVEKDLVTTINKGHRKDAS